VNFNVSIGNGHKLVSLNHANDFETLACGMKLSKLRENGLIQFLGMIEIDSNASINAPNRAGVVHNIAYLGNHSFKSHLCSYKVSFELARDDYDPTQINGSEISNLVRLKEQKAIIEGNIDITYEFDSNQFRVSNDEVECFLAINNTGELCLQVEEALKEGRTSEALSIKKEVINQLKNVSHKDKFGICQQMLQKEEETYEIIEHEGASERAKKTQNMHSKSNVQASGFGTCQREVW
jgi:hypothetical protein